MPASRASPHQIVRHLVFRICVGIILHCGARIDLQCDRLREDGFGLGKDFGRGIAGLVNALDPDVVTLGGLAADLRSAAKEHFEQALLAGLMRVHRERPPDILVARGGEDAPLIGVGLSVLDRVLDAELLARWAMRTQVLS